MLLPATELSGIVPPLATPLLNTDEPDFASLERLVCHVIGGGVSGIFILGTTGEGPSLAREARSAIVKEVCRCCKSVPVLVGLCDPSTKENLALARLAADTGASALVLTPPYYYRLSQIELLDWLRQAIPRLELPVFLYNIPGLTKIRISPEVLKELAAIPNLVGLKDSSGDLEYFAAVRKLLPASTGFRLFCGPEELLAAAVAAGADGGVCGGSNLFPRLYVDLFQAARRGDTARAKALQETVLTVSRNVYQHPDSESAYLRGLKCAMGALGMCRPVLCEPLAPIEGAAALAIREFVVPFAEQIQLAAATPMR